MTAWTQADLDAYEARRRGHKLGPTTAAPRVAGSRETSARASVVAQPQAKVARGASKHKFAAIPTDGPDGMGGTRRYQSKKGARLAQRLESERLAGGIVSWSAEVSIPVGTMGTRVVRHLVDALAILEVRPDGSFVGRFLEAKGFRVRSGEQKRRALEGLLGVKVEVV